MPWPLATRWSVGCIEAAPRPPHTLWYKEASAFRPPACGVISSSGTSTTNGDTWESRAVSRFDEDTCSAELGGARGRPRRRSSPGGRARPTPPTASSVAGGRACHRCAVPAAGTVMKPRLCLLLPLWRSVLCGGPVVRSSGVPQSLGGCPFAAAAETGPRCTSGSRCGIASADIPWPRCRGLPFSWSSTPASSTEAPPGVCQSCRVPRGRRRPRARGHGSDVATQVPTADCDTTVGMSPRRRWNGAPAGPRRLPQLHWVATHSGIRAPEPRRNPVLR